MRSLFAAISGLDNFQTQMDVVGSNVANLNTVGYKASTVVFSDLLNQVLQAGSAPTASRGGTNPVSVGLGVQLSSIDRSLSQGNLQQTGNPTDLAIQGNGYFIVSGSSGDTYTRAGAFSLDSKGNLVDAHGGFVQGWMAKSGTLPTEDAATLTALTVPLSLTSAANATSKTVLAGNLDAGAAVGQTSATEINAYDSLGNPVPIVVTFTNTAQNAWSWQATVSNNGSSTTVGSGNLAFNTSGQISSGGTGTLTYTPSGAQPLNISVDFSSITGYAASSSVSMQSQDGYQSGDLTSYGIGQDGTITGDFSNGQRLTLGQVALASFANPQGLTALGQGSFGTSPNSGAASVTSPGGQGTGQLAPGALEMSNVDLSQEFTNMIVAERAFQANAQVITASDTMLQTLNQIR